METEIVKAIIEPIVKIMVDPIKQHLGYLISYKKIVTKLENVKKDLLSKRDNVQKQVEDYERNSIIPSTDATNCLRNVQVVMDKLQIIPVDVSGCLNLKACYLVGKRASQVIVDINVLIEDRNRIACSNVRRPLGKVQSHKEFTSTQPGSPSMNFESRISTFNSVLKALHPTSKIRTIRLCGMGGVGKTTMMEELKKTAEEKKLFNWIVKVVIGEKPNLISIQKAIAGCIGVTLAEDELDQREAHLYTAFKKILEKK